MGTCESEIPDHFSATSLVLVLVQSRTQAVVDGDFAKLIFQNADLPLALLFENVVDHGGLPRPQETGGHRDGGAVVGGGGCFVGHDVVGRDRL